jgi:hypothetical protein
MTIYRDLDQAGLDAQYNLREAVPTHPAYFARWAAESAAVRARLGCRLDLAYGAAPDETLDLFPAGGGTPGPLLIFLHGGYWQAMDKRDFSFIAPAYLASGPASQWSTTPSPRQPGWTRSSGRSGGRSPSSRARPRLLASIASASSLPAIPPADI